MSINFWHGKNNDKQTETPYFQEPGAARYESRDKLVDKQKNTVDKIIDIHCLGVIKALERLLGWI